MPITLQQLEEFLPTGQFGSYVWKESDPPSDSLVASLNTQKKAEELRRNLKENYPNADIKIKRNKFNWSVSINKNAVLSSMQFDAFRSEMAKNKKLAERIKDDDLTAIYNYFLQPTSQHENREKMLIQIKSLQPGETLRLSEEETGLAHTINIVRLANGEYKLDHSLLDLMGDKNFENQKDQIILDLLKGVKDIHDKGQLHNDIKPQNMMIIEKNGQYRLQVIDSRFTGKAGEPTWQSQGIAIGDDIQDSSSYISPEIASNTEHFEKLFGNFHLFSYGWQIQQANQALGNSGNQEFQNQHPANDMWALGITIFYIRHNRLPKFYKQDPGQPKKYNFNFQDSRIIDKDPLLKGLLNSDRGERFDIDYALSVHQEKFSEISPTLEAAVSPEEQGKIPDAITQYLGVSEKSPEAIAASLTKKYQEKKTEPKIWNKLQQFRSKTSSISDTRKTQIEHISQLLADLDSDPKINSAEKANILYGALEVMKENIAGSYGKVHFKSRLHDICEDMQNSIVKRQQFESISQAKESYWSYNTQKMTTTARLSSKKT